MRLHAWQKWVYYTQWTIALGAAAQCFETAIRFGLQHINSWFYLLIFGITLLQYMLHFQFYRRKKPLNDRQEFFKDHRAFLFVQGALALVLVCYSLFVAGIHILKVLSALGFLTFCYSFFLRSSKRKGIFKYNGLFKIATITVTWAAVTGILPLIAAGEDPLSLKSLFYFGMRLLLMFSLCLPFDVRDVAGDTRNGNITLPAIIGNRNTFLVCYVCLLLNVAGVFASVQLGWNSWPAAIGNAVANVTLLACIWYSSRHLHDNFTWFLLDGNLLIHAIVVWSIMII